MKICRTFPTDEQNDKNRIIFQNALKFALSDEKVFVCDQREQAISIFDLNGKFIKQFGKPGQGPGEFSGPLFINYFKGKIYVTDRGSLRIQIFSEDGIYENAWNLLRFAGTGDIAEDRMMVMSPNRKNEVNPDAPIFDFLNLQGEIIKSIPGNISKQSSDFGTMLKDNYVVIRAIQKEFHLLQVYGDIYRVYDAQGNKLKHVVLERNPLKNPDYKRMKFEYAYPTFDVDQGQIFAHRINMGSIDVDVFDLNGKFLETYRCPIDKNEVCYVSDMKIIKREGKSFFFFLLRKPDNVVVVTEISSMK